MNSRDSTAFPLQPRRPQTGGTGSGQGLGRTEHGWGKAEAVGARGVQRLGAELCAQEGQLAVGCGLE